MKHIKKIPFFCLLLLSCIFFTLCGFIGKDNLYQSYLADNDPKTTPLLAVVFEGIHDGIRPWDVFGDLSPHAGPDMQPSTQFPTEMLTADKSTDTPSVDSAQTELAETPAISDGNDPDNSEFDRNADTTPSVVPTATPTLPPTPTPIPLGPDGLPLVNYHTVDPSYFDDAVFIGDSRTRSLQLYSGLNNTTFLADTGLTIYTVLDKQMTASTGEKTTVRNYLTSHQFRKIYLMLGVNELGTGTTESFVASYSEVLQTIQELQPDALIYLQAILNISQSKQNEGTYINNDTIHERNELLKTLADNQHIYWLDANPAICDENGYLIETYTFDGVHLQAKYVPIWVSWLEEHAAPDPAAETVAAPVVSAAPSAKPSAAPTVSAEPAIEASPTPVMSVETDV